MWKKLLLAVTISTVLFAAGCGDNADKEETKKMENQTTAQEITRKEPTYTSEELKIENGATTIYGRVYTPKGEGKHPLIIMCHGYNGRHTDFAKESLYYAENGYMAYAFDFCGGSVNSKSTGRKTTEMTIFTEKEDLLAVYNYFAKQENVDTDKIFLFGGSQGGLVTALVTDELGSDKVAGMALYFPAFCIPDNWRATYPTVDKIPEVNNFWGMDLGKEFFASIHDFQVFDHIGKYDKNVLIIHGDNDQIVPLSYSERAKNLYPHAELIVYPGEGHGFTPAGGKKAMEEVLKFMNAQ